MTSSPADYVLVTPARNEAAFIEKTLESVIRQTVLPLRWVIVNDGSTDDTAVLVSPYLADYAWIRLVNRPLRKERHFAAKVWAFNAGWEQVRDLDYEVIGNLDADVSLDEDHFEFLMGEFQKDPQLGVAGTIFREHGYSSSTDSFEGQTHVSGQCQLFRRRCFEEIGGYRPNKAGGIDWMAVTTAPSGKSASFIIAPWEPPSEAVWLRASPMAKRTITSADTRYGKSSGLCTE